MLQSLFLHSSYKPAAKPHPNTPPHGVTIMPSLKTRRWSVRSFERAFSEFRSSGLTVLFLAVATLAGAAERTFEFSHLAGTTGGGGYVDGVGAAARLNQPKGIVRDSSGNLFVSETGNSVIRKITPQGETSLFAGAVEQRGHADGTGPAARFTSPWGMCFDQAGNLYVADIADDTIRKISSAGVVSTIAGKAGQPGSVDGPVQDATFDGPIAVAADTNGNLYVVDYRGCTIRKISGGVVTTLAGKAEEFGEVDGAGSAARFLRPSAIVCLPSGDLLVGDSFAIRKVTAAGVVTTIAGNGVDTGHDDGVGAAARFGGVIGLSYDAVSNAVFVCDPPALRKMTLSGTVTTVLSVPASLNPFISGVVADSGGTFFLADGAQAVYKYTASGGVGVFAGAVAEHGHVDGTGNAARFYGPTGIALDSTGNLFVSEPSTIRKITPAGQVTTFVGDPANAGSQDGVGSSAQFTLPTGLAFDKAGNLYVVDGVADQMIRRVTPTGTVTTLVTGGDASWNFPVPIAVDSGGNLVTRFWQNSIQKITPQGDIITLAGVKGTAGSDDGTGSAARFSALLALALDSDGTIYVADVLNNTIRKVTTAGVVTTLAGLANVPSETKDGAGSEARFLNLTGIAIEPSGDLLVTEAAAVRRVTKTGIVTTVGSAPGVFGSSDGVGPRARFMGLLGIVSDSSGTIYLADSGNYAVRKGVPVITNQTTPAITWSAPAAIQSGAPLTQSQLNATATIPGVFSYNPALGTVLTPGTHTLTVTFTPTDTFNYSSSSAQVNLVVGTPASRLANISTRGYCSTGARVMIGGFVIGGTTNKRVLVRAIGPSLGSRGINGADLLADPVIEVHRGEPVIASNDNWGDNTNLAEINTTAVQIGAGALDTSDTKSSVLLLSLQPGAYTFVARGKNDASGIVLLEVYDADPTSVGSALVNIATRAYSKPGDGVTIGGFVISGDAPKQVLLRGVGPTLTNFGITQADTLADPTIELHDASHGNTIIGSNDNWGDNANVASISTVGSRIGASPFAITDSKSSALLLTLAPGVYSFVAAGKAATSGIVLVEIYDAD
jgi:sugar lactone lactonase YvrE